MHAEDNDQSLFCWLSSSAILRQIIPSSYMRKNLHKSNKELKRPLGGQAVVLTPPSIRLSQLEKPTKHKRESSLSWTGRKAKWAVKLRFWNHRAYECLTPFLSSTRCLALDKFLNLSFLYHKIKVAMVPCEDKI